MSYDKKFGQNVEKNIKRAFLLLPPFSAMVNVDLNMQRHFKRLTILDDLINSFIIQVTSTGLMPNR
jgi:hypothetical protein